MYQPQINHYANDDQQAKLTLFGLFAFAVVMCPLMVIAMMRA